MGPKVVNGAYGAMTARLEARNNPSLLVMAYDEGRTRVAAGAERPPRRLAGCNILIGQGPAAGRIPLIRGGLHVPKAAVLDQWRSTLFLRDAGLNARGWLVMRCVEAIGRPEFTLADVYAFEPRLAALYPGNSNVRPKIRQQLQVLRDPGSGPGWLAGVQRARDLSAV